MVDWIARLFSKRVRELEDQLDHCRKLLDGEYEELKLTRMVFENGSFQADCLHEGMAGLLAAWAYNALESCGAENYVEINVNHREAGPLSITCQKRIGETPGTKAARLERELAALKAATPSVPSPLAARTPEQSS